MIDGERLVTRCDVTHRFVVAADGGVGDIDHFLDADGDETTDVSLACFAIVQWRDDHRWSPVELADFPQPVLH